MAQQTTNVNEVLGSIDREIAAVEGEYKAALVVAAEQLSGTPTSVMRAVNMRSRRRAPRSAGVRAACWWRRHAPTERRSSIPRRR